MARLQFVRLLAAMLLLATACHRNGRGSQHGSGVGPVTPAPVVTPAEAPPPGTAELVPVPADVASKVKLVEIAHGLRRPVLLTVAPNDARRRLFILEQHVGEVRFLEGGKLHERPFLVISDLSTG